MSTAKRPLFKRILIITGITLAGILLLLVLVITGGLVWLRTDSATEFVTRELTDVLAEQGIGLSMESLSGPLPGNINIKKLVLTDADGILIAVNEVAFSLRLSALLEGDVEIDEIILDSPEIFRLPASGPDEPEEPEESGGIPVLPVDIILKKAAITRGILYADALAQAPETKKAPTSANAAAPKVINIGHYQQELAAARAKMKGPKINFSTDISAALKGTDLSAALLAALKNEAGKGLDAQISLSADMEGLMQKPENAPKGAALPDGDRLTLAIKGDEASASLLSLLVGQEIPGFTFTLDGDGPVREWHGKLAFILDSPTASGSLPKKPSAPLLSNNAEITLACGSGSFWKDLVIQPDFSIDLGLESTPGPAAPDTWKPVFGNGLDTKIAATAKGETYRADLDMKSPAFTLAVKNLEAAPYSSKSGQTWTNKDGAKISEGLTLKADIDLKATDLTALGGSAQNIPLKTASFTGKINGITGSAFTALDLKAALAANAGAKNYDLDLVLAFTQDGEDIFIKKARLDGLGLGLDTTAHIGPQMETIQAKLLLEAKDHAPWQALAADLLGLAGSGGTPPGGALHLEGDVNLALAKKNEAPAGPKDPPAKTKNPEPPSAAPTPKPSAAKTKEPAKQEQSPETEAASGISAAGLEKAEGQFIFKAQNMRWPTKQLADILGPSVKMEAHLLGGPGKPYELKLNSLEAGIISANGQASFSAEDTLAAAFAAKVANIAPLAGKTSGISGPLALKLKADGPLDNLVIDCDLDSSAIILPPGKLQGLSLKTRTELQQKAEGLTASGKVNANIAGSPGGPVKFGTAWKAAVPADQKKSGPLSAKVEGLSLQGAGLDLQGTLTALLRTDVPGANPLLEGGLNLNIKDWQKTAALSGAPISGAPLKMDIRLTNSRGKQSADLNLSVPSLVMQTPGEDPSLTLENVTAKANAGDLFNKAPAINAELKTGRGLAGPLKWSAAAGSVKGNGGKGDFALGLYSRKALGGKKAPDRLNLKGSFDLPGQKVSLASLSLADPQTKTGLSLAKPFTLGFAGGLEAKGIQFAFKPSGKLAAEATIKNNTLTAKASLDALPFAFFKMFAPEADLPSGVLSAKADITSSAKGPQGQISLQSRLSSKRNLAGSSGSASGVVHSSPGKNSDVFALNFSGDFGASPAQPALKDSGVRPIGGITWFRGNGSFGAESKKDKEGRIRVQVPLRTAANGVPSPDQNAPLEAAINWNGPIEDLWQAAPIPDMHVSGPARFDINVSGTMAKLKPSLTAFLAGVRIEEIVNGILISDINLEARSENANDALVRLSAKDDKKGKFSLEAKLNNLQGASPAIAMRGQLDNFQPFHRDDLAISLSGILGLNGPLSTAKVTGDIVVNNGEVNIAGDFGSSVPQLELEKQQLDAFGEPVESKSPLNNAASEQKAQSDAKQTANTTKRTASTKAKQTAGVDKKKAPTKAKQTADAAKKKTQPGAKQIAGAAKTPAKQGAGPELGIKIRIPRHLFVRGRGLESEWEGNLQISGRASAPSIIGTIKPVRGYFDFMSKIFKFEEGGEIHFRGGNKLDPTIDLTLSNQATEITAYIKIGGSASKPTINFESSPPLPKDEVLSHVLFDKDASKLSRFEALQLASSLSQLTGGHFAPDILTGVRKKTGLDMLSISNKSAETERTTSGQSGEGNLISKKPEDTKLSPALKAGKYINDSIYVGVEQGITPESTAVRVEIELTPHIRLQGKTSATQSEVGIGWKMDY